MGRNRLNAHRHGFSNTVIVTMIAVTTVVLEDPQHHFTMKGKMGSSRISAKNLAPSPNDGGAPQQQK